MTVNQLPVDIGVFVRYLSRLTGLLDRSGGWYGVFRQRDPDGLAACLAGSEIPPWDVVESLLQDLAPAHGAQAVEQEKVRARALHAAAAAAFDSRPGGREALRDRLSLMLREQAYAADRLPGAAPDELPWIHDDLTRATARCGELRSRIAALGPEVPKGWFSERAVVRPRGGEAAAGPEAPAGGIARVPSPRVPVSRPAKRRIGRGARFAGLDASDTATGDSGPLPVAGAAPSGARFGGGPQTRRDHARRKGEPERQETRPDDGARRSVGAAVAQLVRLRRQGRTGEAHAVLCEAATGPARLLPVFAAELHRAGLAADWATLLWEAASLPPDRLAEAAGVLAAAGQSADCHRLLRQGVARPAEQIADAVLALRDAGRGVEADTLLSVFVRVRTPEDAAHLAAHAPDRLAPLLLAAAGEVSDGRRRDVVHAFRVARIATER